MDYSKILFRLVYETPTPCGTSTKEVPLLRQSYSEHRFSDHFIYGYRDGYIDVYEKDSLKFILQPCTFTQVIEFQQKFLLVQDLKTKLWEAYDFTGKIVSKTKFSTQSDLVGYLLYSNTH